MNKPITISLMLALAACSTSPIQAQDADRLAMERELAVTAYNYAVGCTEHQKYEEALEGLSHIPAGQLTGIHQAWADSLRMMCEAMTGHAMAAHEIQLRESEAMALDDQSAAFMRGIEAYNASRYNEAIEHFSEAIDMGEGPRPQIMIEAMFWKGQCQYQLGRWEDCCRDLILFNDTKNAGTDTTCDAMAYYTMGYARMQQKKFHHARLNFERYLDHEKRQTATTREDGRSRLTETRQLEKSGGKGTYRPLDMAKVVADCGETLRIQADLCRVDVQKGVENKQNAEAVRFWKNWKPKYIE